MNFEKYPVAMLSAECIGCFIIVFADNLIAVDNNPQEGGLLTGLIVCLAIYMFGHVGGGLYNACQVIQDCVWHYWQTKFMNWKKCLQYTAAELIGIYVAMFLAWIVLPDDGTEPASNLTPGPIMQNGFEGIRGSIVECFYTYLFCFTTLMVWDSHFPKYMRILISVMLGMIVFHGASTVGAYTGASLNPTIYFGIKSFRFFVTGEISELSQIHWYFIGNFTGAALSLTAYKLLFRDSIAKHYGKGISGEAYLQEEDPPLPKDGFETSLVLTRPNFLTSPINRQTSTLNAQNSVLTTSRELNSIQRK